MGAARLIEQAADGPILLGEAGERLIPRHAFYAAFSSPREYRVVGEGRELGTMPMIHPLAAGEPILFGGRRWRVRELDYSRAVILLDPASDGDAPEFGGSGIAVADRVCQQMRALYLSGEFPVPEPDRP